MATILKGFLDGFRGLLGNAVGAKWRNLDVIKGRPSKSSKPPTAAQLAQQLKFALATGFVSKLSRLVGIGYQSYNSTNMTASNAATQHVLTDAITGVYPDYQIDYTKVAISQGQLLGVDKPTAVLADGDVTVTWIRSNWQSEYGKDTDRLIAVFHDTTIKKNLILEGAITRSNLTFTVSFPYAFIGHPVHGWMFFISADGKHVSDSQYLGQFVVPE